MGYFKSSYCAESLNNIRNNMAEYYSALILNDIYPRLFKHIVIQGNKEPFTYNSGTECCGDDISEKVIDELSRLGYKATLSGNKYTVSVPSIEDDLELKNKAWLIE